MGDGSLRKCTRHIDMGDVAANVLNGSMMDEAQQDQNPSGILRMVFACNIEFFVIGVIFEYDIIRYHRRANNLQLWNI